PISLIAGHPTAANSSSHPWSDNALVFPRGRTENWRPGTTPAGECRCPEGAPDSYSGVRLFVPSAHRRAREFAWHFTDGRPAVTSQETTKCEHDRSWPPRHCL